MLKKTVLDNGLTVISEYVHRLPSFSMSFTLKSGSRAEHRLNNGIHHLIEHMLFKGTNKYSYREIAEISDRLGGNLNAGTGKETTQYYLKSIDEKFEVSFDLLYEIVFNSTFIAEEYEKEKEVVIQEIRYDHDNPDNFAFEDFYSLFYNDNALGYPIGGIEKDIKNISRDQVYEYYKELYRPENIIISSCGNVEHARLVESLKRHMQSEQSAKPADFAFLKPELRKGVRIRENNSLKQAYILWGFKGLEADSNERYTFSLMNNILGVGMSSVLFQRIREELGLAYEISSMPHSYCDSGIHIIYSKVEPANIIPLISSLKEEILRLKSKTLDREIIENAKDYIKTSVILGLESSMSKMMLNVNQELYLGREMKVREIMDKINSVTPEDIRSMFENYLDLTDNFLYIYGNVDSLEEADIKELI